MRRVPRELRPSRAARRRGSARPSTVYASWPATFDGSAPETVQCLPSSVRNVVISSSVGVACRGGAVSRLRSAAGRTCTPCSTMRRRPSTFVSFQTICTSPASDCSSRRPPFSFSQSRPVAPGHQCRAGLARERTGGEELVREGDPRRDSAGFAAVSASWIAWASGFGGGVGPLPPRAATATTAATSTAATATSRAIRRDGREGAEDLHGGPFSSSSPAGSPTDSEAFLTAGSSIVKREPSTEARPPCRSAVARTIASPRPEPRPSRSARRSARGRPRGSRAVVLDGE